MFSRFHIEGSQIIFSRSSEGVLEIVTVFPDGGYSIRSALHPDGLQDAKELEKKLLEGHICNKSCSDWQTK